jgi:excisionase family DNA binding protein
MERLLYDKAAAAEMLSTSERRIDELRRAGHLTAVRDGREYKYRVADLEDYVASLPDWDDRDEDR